MILSSTQVWNEERRTPIIIPSLRRNVFRWRATILATAVRRAEIPSANGVECVEEKQTSRQSDSRAGIWWSLLRWVCVFLCFCVCWVTKCSVKRITYSWRLYIPTIPIARHGAWAGERLQASERERERERDGQPPRLAKNTRKDWKIGDRKMGRCCWLADWQTDCYSAPNASLNFFSDDGKNGRNNGIIKRPATSAKRFFRHTTAALLFIIFASPTAQYTDTHS